METAPSVPNESAIGGNSQKTEVLYGQEAILQKSIQVFLNVKETLDSCLDASGPSIITKVEQLMHLSREASARGGSNRIVTEITKDNLSDCKKLMKIVQLRHMDGIRGNFNISDRKFYGGG